MKRTFVITTASILLLITLTIGALYWALQGQYASAVVNRISEQLSLPVTVYEVEFNLPNHVALSGVDIEGLQQTPVSISKLDIWVTLSSLFSSNPTIDSILIDGVSLQHGIPDIPETVAVTLKQLAIKNLDYSDENIIGRDISIQIKDPHFSDGPLPLPYGTIQFSAEQIYWRGEALDSLLIDADYKPETSTIYGLSFDWRGGKFSGQAEQYPSGWSLVNFTIDSLRLTNRDWQEVSELELGDIRRYVDHINSLDVLKSSVATPWITISNFDLSLENVKLTADIWQQKEGYASLDAGNIEIGNHNLVEPAFQARMNEKRIEIEEFATEFQQGSINTKGIISPESADLEFLSINGMKWIPENSDETDFITNAVSLLSSLKVGNLEVKHSQFIQLTKETRWQLSGLNIEGSNLYLIKDGTFGLWQGALDLSVNSASYNDLLSSQLYIRMQNDKGIWSLQEAFIPLENGLIEATGTYNLNEVSQPWRFEVAADGIPVQFLSNWYPLPVDIEGVTEFQLSTSGLGGDRRMFNHSFSAEVIGSIRNASLIENRGDDTSLIQHPVQISDIQIQASRGQIEMKPTIIKGRNIKGLLEAKVDLLDVENGVLKLSLEEECQKKEWDLISGSESLNIHCSID